MRVPKIAVQQALVAQFVMKYGHSISDKSSGIFQINKDYRGFVDRHGKSNAWAILTSDDSFDFISDEKLWYNNLIAFYRALKHDGENIES